MARVLVTGGLGLIGSAVISQILSTSNHAVVVLDDCSSPNSTSPVLKVENTRLEIIKQRVEDASLLDICRDVDIVIHLAARVGVCRTIKSSPGLIFSTIDMTRIVADAVAHFRIPLIYASSSEVYGVAPPVPVCEDYPMTMYAESSSRGAYAVSKAASEVYLSSLVQKYIGIPAVALRFFNVSGPSQSSASGMVIPSMIDSALRTSQIKVVGDGTQIRTFIHVADAADALIRCMNQLLAKELLAKGGFLPLNIGGTEPTSMNHLAVDIANLCGDGIAIQHVSTSMHYGRNFLDTTQRIPCIHRARSLLCWEPKIPLLALIQEVVYARRQAETNLSNNIPKKGRYI